MNKIQTVVIYKNHSSATMVMIVRQNIGTHKYWLSDNVSDLLYKALENITPYVNFGKNHIHVFYDLWRVENYSNNF